MTPLDPKTKVLPDAELMQLYDAVNVECSRCASVLQIEMPVTAFLKC